jgi:hypothetical protein
MTVMNAMTASHISATTTTSAADLAEIFGV